MVSPTGVAKLWDTTDVPSKPLAAIQLVNTQAEMTDKPTTMDQKIDERSLRIVGDARASAMRVAPIAMPIDHIGRPLKLLMKWAIPWGSLAAVPWDGKRVMRSQAPGPESVA